MEDACQKFKVKDNQTGECIKNLDGDCYYELDPVVDTSCYVRCKSGYYHETVGNKNPFNCAPDFNDRTKQNGRSTAPAKCERL